MKDITNLKYLCTQNVYLYIQTKQDVYKIDALRHLKDLAECYHLKVKKVKPIDLNSALTQFFLNKSGIGMCINVLHSSINQ